jgi:NarL family two-component system response regulator LiaR
MTGPWRSGLTTETIRHARSNSKRLSRPIILIVEDHRRLRAELRDWLTLTFPGCSALEVGSGEEAVQFAESHSPDIVLMDLVLPGISGIEATSRIKATAPQSQVVILTFREETDCQPALRAGAVSFVHKSEMARELPRLLAPLLNHPTPKH